MRQRNEQFEEILQHFENFEGDDTIIQTMKLRKTFEAFNRSVTSEKLTSDLFDILNTRALEKGDTFIQNFVSIVTSRQFDDINMNGKVMRHFILDILQKNFKCSDKFKRDDMSKFYNSIRLLGEFYNKARISSGSPINILATSLLNILNVELEKELKNSCHLKNDEFSYILLGQMALNGPLLKDRHKTEMEVFLMHIRRCLIELDDLSSKSKAFLLMILDLHYSNFNYTLLQNCLEKLYNKYLPDSASHESKVQTVQKREESPKSPVVIKSPHENGHKSHPIASTSKKSAVKPERRSENYRNGPPKSPTKTSPPSRKSEPQTYHNPASNVHYRYIQQQPPKSPQQKSSPQKKVSPRDLRNRVKNERGSSTPPMSPKALEKDFDKLNIEAARQRPPQKSPEQVKTQSNVEENILRQQNSSENSSPSGTLKAKQVTNSNNKVYFKEENAENLSWNGETSFEDDPETTIESPRVSQYSSSFLNFLSNN